MSGGGGVLDLLAARGIRDGEAIDWLRSRRWNPAWGPAPDPTRYGFPRRTPARIEALLDRLGGREIGAQCYGASQQGCELFSRD